MVVLLKDKKDESLMAFELAQAFYSPETSELYLYAHNDDTPAVISDISTPLAEIITKKLFSTGKMDLTHFPATYQFDNDETEEN